MSVDTNPVDGTSAVTIAEVRFEHLRETLGVGVLRPRLSWIVETAAVRWYQTGYEIEVYGTERQLRDGTGRVESDQSALVPWPFAPLSSRECASVRVRVWNVDGQPSAWSILYAVEAGVLSASPLPAPFFPPAWGGDNTRLQPFPLLPRQVELRGGGPGAGLVGAGRGAF